MGFAFTSLSKRARTSTAWRAMSICAATSGFLSRPRFCAAWTSTSRLISSSFTAFWRSGVLGWPLAVSSLFIVSMRDCGIVTPFTTILPPEAAVGAAAFFGAFSWA